METTLLSDFKKNTTTLLDFIHQVDATHLLVNPSREEWSIMDCCEHILQLEQALIRLFRGSVEKVNEAASEQTIAIIKNRLLAIDNKMTAFGIILPQRIYKNKEDISQAIQETRTMLHRIGTNNGWNKKCMMYAHPSFGHLTRLEWIAFCTYHVERHLYQMKSILTKLSRCP